MRLGFQMLVVQAVEVDYWCHNIHHTNRCPGYLFSGGAREEGYYLRFIPPAGFGPTVPHATLDDTDST
ncbi:MAG: hypothetical protein IPP49_12085 [Saprospiraceae bacterium]|nr:hypothetical protein [Saprospiraceae bacterium]